MISRALSALGLMKRSEHEVIVAENDNRAYDSWIKMINERDFYVDEYKVLEAKFKLATTDLAKQAEEIEGLKADLDLKSEAMGNLSSWVEGLEGEVRDLRPDALKWRNSLKRSRDRKAARKGSVS